ncbi:hypothetical protein EDB19DRAFT_1978410 [Suillus lakei]|nr:hypothetical protein EDB19DRAFT_1978410 [Suillus lakei]
MSKTDRLFTMYSIDTVHSSYTAAKNRVRQYVQFVALLKRDEDAWAQRLQEAGYVVMERSLYGVSLDEIKVEDDQQDACSINMSPPMKERQIERIERKTFVYDDKRSTRNELDVYYPLNSTLTKDGKTPILFFVYGGGYNSGSKEFPEPFSMGYRALGSFFAQHGFIITIIPDFARTTDLFQRSSSRLHPRTFVMQSIGFSPMSTSLPYPRYPDKCYIYHGPLSGPGTSLMRKRFRTEVPAQQYIGSQEKQREREPKALWNAPSDEQIKDHPDILLVRAEREPDWLLLSWEEILPDIEKRLGKAPQMIIGKGHNHISPNWASMFRSRGRMGRRSCGMDES